MQLVLFALALFIGLDRMSTAGAGAQATPLPPVSMAEASLTVVGPKGEVIFTPEGRGGIGNWRQRTVPPWTPLLVATRAHGKPHIRHQRGPLQFVLNLTGDTGAGARAYQQNRGWMAARIDATSGQ